jgi:hypothetical protein
MGDQGWVACQESVIHYRENRLLPLLVSARKEALKMYIFYLIKN